MIKEEWRKIEGYKDWYLVSNLGRLKTLNWKNSKKERVMKPALDGSGYLRTMLKSDDGKFHTIKVHRIVAKTFIDNPINKETVNHINLIKSDNRVSNLEWMTRSENFQHAIDNGAVGFRFEDGVPQHSNCVRIGELCGTSKLKEYQVLEIRAKFKPRIYTRQMLAEEYKVKSCTIKDIVLRRSWRHI